ncbi:MAG: CDP-alcohol phosphatidyltransferase family protein [Patescibacteria group bacterium]
MDIPVNEFPKTKLHRLASNMIWPLVFLLLKLKIQANYVTFAGVGFSIVAALALSRGHWLIAVVFILLNGLCDCLDGDLAKNTASQFEARKKLGQFLDPYSDRISDTCFFLGLLAYSIHHYPLTFNLWIIGALAAHLISSWIRAKVENLGFRFHRKKCFTRATLQLALIIICLGQFLSSAGLQDTAFLWTTACLLCWPKIHTFLAWSLRATLIIRYNKNIGIFS